MFLSSEKNLVLIGMMGVGKSTVGRHLAVALKKDFLTLIEKSNVTVVPLYLGFSMSRARPVFVRENQAIANICLGENIVLATGGGAVVREK